MTSLYLFNLDKLKSDFQDILKTQLDVQTHKTVIIKQIQDLKGVYNDLVKTNTKKIFLFCLDSFYFQYKTLVIQMEDLCKHVTHINNRMYGDYYKLYNIILSQTAESNIDVRSSVTEFHKKYQPYKDLEPFHEYKMSDIISLHADILKLMNYLFQHYSGKEQNVMSYSDNTKVGMSITSFLQTLEYENTLLREQIGLYVNYLTFFHNSQKIYLTKIYEKIQGFQQEIESEILVNRHGSSKPVHKKCAVEGCDTLVQNGATFCDIHGSESDGNLVNLLTIEDETSLQKFLSVESEELSDVERMLFESEKELDMNSQLIDNIVLEPEEEDPDEEEEEEEEKEEEKEPAADEIPMEITESAHTDESQHQPTALVTDGEPPIAEHV
jgi:hypothetical protein